MEHEQGKASAGLPVQASDAGPLRGPGGSRSPDLRMIQNVNQRGLLVEVAHPPVQGTSTDVCLLVGGVITRADIAVVWMTALSP